MSSVWVANTRCSDAVARRVVSAVDVAWWESEVRAFTGSSRGAAKLTVQRYEVNTEMRSA